jgi:WW domain-binding protein 4
MSLLLTPQMGDVFLHVTSIFRDLCRWYYDPKTQWYYGGEPVAWTQKPGLPSAAMFGAAPHEGGPEPQPAAAAGADGGGGSSKAAARGSSVQEAAAAAAAATGQKVVVRQTVMQLPSHPQSAIGGHQMPTSGRIGGAKGVGSETDGDADAAKVGLRLDATAYWSSQQRAR